MISRLQRAKQGVGDVMLRATKHFPGVALLDHPVMLQYHRTIAELADHLHFEGDQYDDRTQAIDIAQQRKNRLPFWVESAHP